MLEANCFDCHGVEVWIGVQSSLSTAFFLNPIQPRRCCGAPAVDFELHPPRTKAHGGEKGGMVLEQWSRVNGGNE